MFADCKIVENNRFECYNYLDIGYYIYYFYIRMGLISSCLGGLKNLTVDIIFLIFKLFLRGEIVLLGVFYI